MRVLSYNIHKGIGGRDRLYRLERIIGVIEEQNPDLICLQEVDRHVRRSHYHDQPRLLAEYFHAAAHLFQLNVHLLEGGYGNLVLSRWPLASGHQVSLRHGDRKPRGAQLAVVETPVGSLHLVNWHLGLAEVEREWQAGHLLRHPLFHAAAHLPTLVVGDFNDWRNALPRGALREHGLRHVTAPISRFRSFPAFLAVGSLDKAYCCRRVEVHHAFISHTKLARLASDHLPLVVDFDLAAGGAPKDPS